MSKKNILFISPVKYDALKQRHQGITIELAKRGYFVYYINPLCSNGFSCKINKNSTNLKIIDIKIPFKATSYPFLQNILVTIAFKLLKKKLHLNENKIILWIADPSWAKIAEYKWAKIIYDCCDLHGNFPNQISKIWQYYEQKIATVANLITISHPYLKEHFTLEQKKKSLLVPNATFFKKLQIPILNNEIINNNKIKLLSSGAHYEWVDIDWLKMLTTIDNVELHIAGTGRGKYFKELIAIKNVIFHGKLNSTKLFELMKDCQIGLIPFKDIELIKGVDPIKAYDYASAGLDIWAPDIEALHPNKMINFFIKDINDAKMSIKTFKRREKKLSNIIVPSWSDRVEFLLQYLQ